MRMAGSSNHEAVSQRPIRLLGGLFTALAFAGLALGTYPILAPLCVLIVVGAGWFVPRDGDTQFAKGAFAAFLGLLLFGFLTFLFALV